MSFPEPMVSISLSEYEYLKKRASAVFDSEALPPDTKIAIYPKNGHTTTLLRVIGCRMVESAWDKEYALQDDRNKEQFIMQVRTKKENP